MDHIILTGFMGTGKTTVGKILAGRLSRAFVDIDGKVADGEGREISAIFAAEGEEYFRHLERKAIKDALEGERKVISTGGGALLGNRDILEAGGLLICLTASAGEIVKRIAKGEDRPLLAGDPEEKIKALFSARRDMYQQVSVIIDTEGKSPEEVASEILECLSSQMQQ